MFTSLAAKGWLADVLARIADHPAHHLAGPPPLELATLSALPAA
jgi:hypothetical protein